MTTPHVFVHVPRTGGTNLANVLSSYGDRIRLFRENDPKTGPEKALAFWDTHKGEGVPVVLMGHHLMGVHKLLGTLPSYYTILRDPIDRDISGYHYVLDPRSRHPWHKYATRLGMLGYLNRYVHDNTHTRIVLGDREAYSGRLNPGHVNLAGWTLKTMFRYVGRFDRYAESVRDILSLIGLPPCEVDVMESKTPTHRYYLSADEQRVIENRNTLDRELYATQSQAREAGQHVGTEDPEQYAAGV